MQRNQLRPGLSLWSHWSLGWEEEQSTGETAGSCCGQPPEDGAGGGPANPAGHSSFSYPTCPAWPWKILEVFTLAIWWSVNKVQFAALPPVVLSAWCASKAPTCPRLVRCGDTAGYLCLKRPSFFCLIHFYKRCVSSLTLMGRSPWVRSGWVSVLSVTTFFIQG